MNYNDVGQHFQRAAALLTIVKQVEGNKTHNFENNYFLFLKIEISVIMLADAQHVLRI